MDIPVVYGSASNLVFSTPFPFEKHFNNIVKLDYVPKDRGVNIQQNYLKPRASSIVGVSFNT